MLILIYLHLKANGMEVCIYDAKVRKDELTARWLGSALANIYFYHGTVIKVHTNIEKKIIVSKIIHMNDYYYIIYFHFIHNSDLK